MKKILNPRTRCTDHRSPIADRKLPIRSSSSGMALVITLCLIVLVTVAAVAFFTRATGNRTVEASRVNQTLAAQVAESGADYAVGRLLLEIATNSIATTNNSFVVYFSTNPASALPRRLLSAGVSTNDTNCVNLVRQSVPNNSADTNASSHGVATPSRNGRLVGANRWNAPMLLGGGGFTTTNQLPNWIYLNRDGSVTGSVTAATASNVIGRFAYNLYDQGGLLDVNVSGYPSGVSGANLSILKGALAGADLSVIPGITSAANMNTFVQWRNTNSASTAASYVTNVSAAATNGFLTPRPGDRNLLNRQDLIALARSGAYGITTNALPYLTTFTRTLNSPSWTPTNASGTAVDYAANRDLPASANRFLPNVRVASAFTRADGTPSQIGEPLLKTRFPLSRLAGIGRTGVNTTGTTTLLNGAPSAATAATIQRDFGLVWSIDRWRYAGPSGSTALTTIATLGSVSGREPNFFELLKASILSGSLGRTAGTSWMPNSTIFDAYTDDQIIQIGANIIDQYDGDSYPVRINFNGNDYAGIENLPYFNRLVSQYYRLTTDPTNNRGYFLMELFNPHRPKANTNAPTNFRVLARGRVRISVGSVEDATKAPVVYNYGAFQPDSTPGAYRNTDASITAPATRPNGLKNALGPLLSTNPATTPPLQFSIPVGNTNLFTWPTLLTQRVAGANVTSSGNNSVTDGSVQFVGFYAGQVTCSTPTYGNWLGPVWNPCYGAMMNVTSYLSFFLQYQDPAGSWVNYSSWQSINWGDWDGGGNRPVGDPTSPAIYFQSADPRSSRFGLFLNYCHARTADPTWTGPTYQDALFMTSRPDSTATVDTQFAGLPYGAPFSQNGAPPSSWGPSPLANNPDGAPSYRFAYLAENRTTLPTFYRDNDNILRNGDAAYASNSTAGWGQPLEQVNAARGLPSRPVMLDRPFRSVAEMGYAFRDLPCRSIDFFTANSADAALLDTFCLTESPISGVTAGVINPNSANQPALRAVLAGVLKDELDASSVLAATTEADSVARTVTNATAAAPLLHRSELATRVAPALTVTNFANNPADASIKARRESVVRALADVGNTRTWNVMIDVIAQAGKFPPNSAGGAGDFLVEGERRSWLHAAIDRLTGRVVARSMESINE
jgi:Tfp pilus assembly protein PilX